MNNDPEQNALQNDDFLYAGGEKGGRELRDFSGLSIVDFNVGSVWRQHGLFVHCLLLVCLI